jgi:hypothetical protein
MVAAAQTKTASAGSARISMTVDVKAAPGATSGATSIRGSGAFDFAHRVGSLDLSIPDPSSGQPLSITVLFSSDVIYEKLPASIMHGLPGGPWLKIDLRELSRLSGSGMDLSSLTQGSTSDPSQVLEVLLGASSDAAVVGNEQVRGTETTHYRMTADLNKVASRLPADERSAYEGFAKGLGTTSMPTDVWIDSAGRARRIQYTITIPISVTPSGGSGSSVSTTIEFYDFGVPVIVTTPPPSQVSDLSQLLGGGGASGTPSP